MNLRKRKESFGSFPYKKDYTEGRTNNGGIDLVKYPEKINEITEANNFPELKQILTSLNSEESLFMTLGCEVGEQDNLFYGYLEFSFRDSELSKNEEKNNEIINSFRSWFFTSYPDCPPEMLDQLVWEFDDFKYYKTFHGIKISLWFRMINQEDAGNLLLLFENFLCNIYS